MLEDFGTLMTERAMKEILDVLESVHGNVASTVSYSNQLCSELWKWQ